MQDAEPYDFVPKLVVREVLFRASFLGLGFNDGGAVDIEAEFFGKQYVAAFTVYGGQLSVKSNFGTWTRPLVISDPRLQAKAVLKEILARAFDDGLIDNDLGSDEKSIGDKASAAAR